MFVCACAFHFFRRLVADLIEVVNGDHYLDSDSLDAEALRQKAEAALFRWLAKRIAGYVSQEGCFALVVEALWGAVQSNHKIGPGNSKKTKQTSMRVLREIQVSGFSGVDSFLRAIRWFLADHSSKLGWSPASFELWLPHDVRFAELVCLFRLLKTRIFILKR